MLTNAFKGIGLENIFLKKNYGKMIKQLISLIAFYISHESSVKNFYNMIYYQLP